MPASPPLYPSGRRPAAGRRLTAAASSIGKPALHATVQAGGVFDDRSRSSAPSFDRRCGRSRSQGCAKLEITQLGFGQQLPQPVQEVRLLDQRPGAPDRLRWRASGPKLLHRGIDTAGQQSLPRGRVLGDDGPGGGGIPSQGARPAQTIEVDSRRARLDHRALGRLAAPKNQADQSRQGEPH